MTTTETIIAVERFLAIPFLLMGLSHILQPQLWIGFFRSLSDTGGQAVLWRTFVLELWPAVLIVSFHQDWSWPGIVLTLYGHALLAKIAISLLAPDWGARSLRHAGALDGNGMRAAGTILFCLGLFCVWRAFL